MQFRRVALVVTLGGTFVWACKDFVSPGGSAGRTARQLQLDSAQFLLVDGDTFRLKAQVLDQNDSVFDTLPGGVTLGWSSSAPAVASVSATGLVTGVGPGQAQITATVKTALGSFAASAAATVIQPLVRLVAVSGGSQQDTIGAVLRDSLVVQALDSAGRGVRAVAIQFAAHGGSVSATTATTDTGGRARVAWTLPTAVGVDSVVATSGLLPDSAVRFTARTVAGAPSAATAVAGSGQSGTVGAALPARLVVRVVDRAGNAVAGDSVRWAATVGGGSLAPAASLSDTSGQAQAVWTLGSLVGAQSATATAAGVASPVGFAATAAAGTAASIAVGAGNNQSAAAGTAVSVAPSVIVKDAFGNPVAGVAVAFAVTAGGGSVTGGSQTTGANGVATVGSWKLGPTAGADSLTATAAGSGISGNPVTFTATATAAGSTPASIAAFAGDNDYALAGTAVIVAPAVIVKDSTGNPVAGVAVTFAVASGGGSVTGASQTTGANGVATVGSWTLGATQFASNTLRATATGSSISGNPVTFTATGTGPASQIAPTAGNGQSATVGTSVATAPAVLVRDRFGNPVPGVAVTFAIVNGGGGITGASQTTGPTGVATVGSWKLGTTAGLDSLSATAAGSGITGNPAVFVATAVAAAPASIAVSAGNNQSATVSTSVTVAPAVIVKDSLGNPVSGVSVTFAVATGGGSVTGATPATGANGVAAVGSWTLGAAAGANTLTATASGSGIAGNPVTFTATGTSSVTATLRTWVGGNAGGTTDWSNPNNWSPAGVPGLSDTALIPATANSPVLSANASVAQVRTTGDSLTLNGHTLTVSGPLAVGGGVVVMRNALDSLIVTGNATFGGADETGKLTAGVLVVDGNFSAPGASTAYDFVASGAHVTVLQGTQPQSVSLYYAGGNASHFQNLVLAGSGPVTLSGRVPALGNVTVTGTGSVTGTDTLYVGGNLTTAAMTSLTVPGLEINGALAVSGTYAVGVTYFIGGGQTIPPLSYTNVYVMGGTTTLGSRVVTTGNVTLPNGATLAPAGHTLVVGGALNNPTGALVMTNAQDSVIVAGNATFSGGDESGRLTAGVLVVDGNFSAPPGSGGIEFNPSGTHTTVLAGTQPQTATIAYAGGNNSHFQNLVLAGSGQVTLSGRIPALGNVTVTGTGAVTGTDTLYVGGNLTTGAGTTLTLPGVEVNAALNVSGSYAVGVTNFVGTNQTVPVLSYQTLAVTGGATSAAAGLTVPGDLIVRAAGSLTLAGRTAVADSVIINANTLTVGGHTLAVGGALLNTGGALVMTSAQDSVIVTGDATFGGSDETGKLTAGVLVVSGNFSAPGAQSATAFVASGTHKTVLAGTRPQVVSLYYAGGNTAHFQDLDVAVGAHLTLATRVPVSGSFRMIDRDTVFGADSLVVGSNFTMQGDSTLLILPGVVVGGAMSVHGLYSAGVTTFTGTNQVIPTGTVVYDTLAITGPGATTQDTTIPVAVLGALFIRGNGALTLVGPGMTVTKNVIVSAGNLTLNGHLLLAQDSLTITGSGVLVMTNTADSLATLQTATFGGGDETGKLTSGFLAVIGGNIIQPGGPSANSFVTSDGFTTELYSTGTPQLISFYYAASANFTNLVLSGDTSGVTLGSDVTVNGWFTDSAPVTRAGVFGNGHKLSVVGDVRVASEIFDHTLLTLQGGILEFDNVTFQDYGPGDDQLKLISNGIVTMSGLTFTSTPTTGHYVVAEGYGGQLTVTISSNLSPASAAALTELIINATVTWQ